jgi:DNA-binding MarR family transcriptional regulator
MSTGSTEAAPGTEEEAVAVAEAAVSTDLGNQTAAFVDQFERWAHRRAIEAGASVPRIRLLYSIHCNGPQKMADLAEELTVTPRNVTALVDGLEAEGLVRRIAHSTDRRVTLVELTCNSELVESQFRSYQTALTDLISTLSESDQRDLARMLGMLRERMATRLAGSPAPKAALDA